MLGNHVHSIVSMEVTTTTELRLHSSTLGRLGLLALNRSAGGRMEVSAPTTVE